MIDVPSERRFGVDEVRVGVGVVVCKDRVVLDREEADEAHGLVAERAAHGASDMRFVTVYAGFNLGSIDDVPISTRHRANQ